MQILDGFTNEDITEKFGINQLNAAAGLQRRTIIYTPMWKYKLSMECFGTEFLLYLKTEKWTQKIFLMANKKEVFQTECWLPIVPVFRGKDKRKLLF